MRIRILVELCRHKKFNFYMEKIFYVGNTGMSLIKDAYSMYRRNKGLFWKARNQLYLLILVNFLAPGSGSAFQLTDPDPGCAQNTKEKN